MANLLVSATCLFMVCHQQTIQDEADVPEYDLPDPLVCSDGEVVADADGWVAKRRPELLELFRSEVYGITPFSGSCRPETLDLQDALSGKAVRKQVRLAFARGVEIDLLLYLPGDVTGPVPVFLAANFLGNQSIHPDTGIELTRSWCRNDPDKGFTDNRATEASRGVRAGRWPVERILDRGYGLATFHYSDVDPDFDDGFRNGVHALGHDIDGVDADRGSWGSISAWAWGLSRVLDHLIENEPAVDGERVMVMGHSRLGKTALWAGANDERFALAISNNSGCGGAALFRRRFGETITRINKTFPHWFCERFDRYDDREQDLPIDQHMLVALMAPRPVYIASATKDLWADPRGEFLSGFHANEVYELFGKRGTIVDEMPEPDRPVGDFIGYHLRTGRHDVTPDDWEHYLDFADRHVGTSADWRPLTQPGSFNGWHVIDGGEWNWSGDVLVGTSPRTERRHGLLVTDEVFDDFMVRCRFRAVRGDSGFYFRVAETGDMTGVSGFQAEIDTTLETGGLYETRGRGWVVKPDPTMMEDVYEPGEWARLELTARGGDIEVRINGVVTSSLKEDQGRTSGHIALQLHGSQDLHVEFRDIEIRELGGKD